MATHLPLLSVVIPTWGDKGVDLVNECVKSIQATHAHLPPNNLEIVAVSDNDEPAVLEKLKFVCADLNIGLLWLDARGGFAQACNAGIKSCNGAMVYLVNNDTKFTEPSLQIMWDCANLTGAGVIGCQLLYQDDTIQFGGTVFVPITDVEKAKALKIPGFFDHAYRGDKKNCLGACTVRPSLLTGAVMGITRWAIDCVGLLDERYLFSCEDVDYCLRSIEAGREPFYCGYTSVYHYEGKTRGRTPEEKALLAPDIAEKEMASLQTLFHVWYGVPWQNFMLRR